jgi:hypothetical protein
MCPAADFSEAKEAASDCDATRAKERAPTPRSKRFEMLRIPHYLDNWLIDGAKVVSPAKL